MAIEAGQFLFVFKYELLKQSAVLLPLDSSWYLEELSLWAAPQLVTYACCHRCHRWAVPGANVLAAFNSCGRRLPTVDHQQFDGFTDSTVHSDNKRPFWLPDVPLQLVQLVQEAMVYHVCPRSKKEDPKMLKFCWIHKFGSPEVEIRLVSNRLTISGRLAGFSPPAVISKGLIPQHINFTKLQTVQKHIPESSRIVFHLSWFDQIISNPHVANPYHIPMFIDPGG